MSFTSSVITVFISIALATPAGAQKRGKPSKTPSRQQKPSVARSSDTSTFSTQPFDLTVERLPAQYHGHDPELIYKALETRKKSATKGEFETTEEFRLRVQREEAA